MSQQRYSIRMHRDRIVMEALSVRAMTIVDLVDYLAETEVPLSLSVCRRTVSDLVGDGLVRFTGQVINKRPYYQAATLGSGEGKQEMPSLLNMHNNQMYHPVDFIALFAKTLNASLTDGSSPLLPSQKAIRSLPIAISELLHLAQYKKEHPEQDIGDRLGETRKSLQEARSVIAGQLKMLDQLLSIDTFWSNKLIRDLTRDPKFEPGKIEQYYEIIQRFLFKEQTDLETTNLETKAEEQ